MQNLAALHVQDDNVGHEAHYSFGLCRCSRQLTHVGSKGGVKQLDEAMKEALQYYGSEMAQKLKLQVQFKSW